jgi:hypothetical protein
VFGWAALLLSFNHGRILTIGKDLSAVLTVFLMAKAKVKVRLNIEFLAATEYYGQK